MTRSEHLEWAKHRANEILDRGAVVEAWTSFTSDMKKHEELANHKALEIGLMMMLNQSQTVSEARHFIDGFN